MAAFIRGITAKQLKVTPVLFCEKLNVRIKRKLEMQEYLWTEVDDNDKYNQNILKMLVLRSEIRLIYYVREKL